MAVYVDDLGKWNSGWWCHMWSDTSDQELDQFAAKIGLKEQWSQLHTGISGRFYHYDLRPSKRTLALQSGACYMPIREWVKRRMEEQAAAAGLTVEEWVARHMKGLNDE